MQQQHSSNLRVSDYSRYTKHCTLRTDSIWRRALTQLPPYDINSKDGGGEIQAKPSLFHSLSDWNEPCNVLANPFLVGIQTLPPASSSKHTPANKKSKKKQTNTQSPWLQMLCFLHHKSLLGRAVCLHFLHASSWNTKKKNNKTEHRRSRFALLTSKMHQGRRLEGPVRARCVHNHPGGSASTCQHEWAEAGGREEQGSPG